MRKKLYVFVLLLTITGFSVAACSLPGSSEEVEPIILVVTATTEEDSGDTESSPRATALILQDLNVRTGPGSENDIVGVLPGGTTVDVVGRVADSSWLQIIFPSGPGGLGWVSTPFTQPSDLTSVPILAAPVVSSDVGSGGSGNPPTAASSGGSGGESATATSSSSGGGGNSPTATSSSGNSPTATPEPTATATPTPEGEDEAPADSNYNVTLEFKSGVNAKCCPTLQGEISYPNGDTSDKINFELEGFDSVTFSATTIIIVTCSGTGSENVKIKFGNNPGLSSCNKTYNSNWTEFNAKGSITIFLESGGSAYVTWTVVFISDKG